MFRDVVLEGTGTQAAIPGYTVAGKTGTAQKAENGRYVTKYVASFVGLVPAKNPRLAILVMVDEPHGDIYGGSRRRAGVPRHRAVRSPVPRGAARRARDEDAADGDAGGAGEPVAASAGRASTPAPRRRMVLRGPRRPDARARREREHAPAEPSRSPTSPTTRDRVTPGAVFFCVPGSRADGHEFAARAVAAGAVALVVERPLELDVPQLARRGRARVDGGRRRRLLRRADARARGRRRDGHERQDDDDVPPALRPRGRRALARARRHRRVGRRRRGAAGAAHDARGDRPAAPVPRDARRGRPERRRRGLVARLGAAPARPRALRRARLHEPLAGPPRPARDDGGLLPGEAPPLHGRAAAAGGGQRRRRARPPARARARRVAPRAARSRSGSTDAAEIRPEALEMGPSGSRFRAGGIDDRDAAAGPVQRRERARRRSRPAILLDIDDDELAAGRRGDARRSRDGSRRSTRASRSR